MTPASGVCNKNRAGARTKWPALVISDTTHTPEQYALTLVPYIKELQEHLADQGDNQFVRNSVPTGVIRPLFSAFLGFIEATRKSMNGQELRKELNGLRRGQQKILEQQQALLEKQSIAQFIPTVIKAWNSAAVAAEPRPSQVLTPSSTPPAPASRDREITIKVTQKNAKINTGIYNTPQALTKETMRRFAGTQELKALEIEAAHVLKSGDIKFSMKNRGWL